MEQQKRHWKNKLEERWGISGWGQIAIIFFVFSVTGSLAVRLGKPVLSLLGINSETLSPYIFWPLRIIIIFPIYQVLLITIGTICGQFKFFWALEKKMYGRMFLKNKSISKK